MTYVAIGCRALLSIVFAVAVIGKLRNRTAFRLFAESLPRMGVVPRAWARPVAVAVVAAECASVLALAAPVGTLAFGPAAAVMLALTAGVALALAGGDREPCRCFGGSATVLSVRHLARNTALLAVAAVGLLAPPASTPVEPGTAAVALAAGALVGGLVVKLDDIIEVVRPT